MEFAMEIEPSILQKAKKNYLNILDLVNCPDTNFSQRSCIDNLLEIHSQIISQDELLKKIFSKSKSRPKNDNKVPPGSSKVIISLTDERYLLNKICILLSKLYSDIGEFDTSLHILRESLLWFPRSIEALGNYGDLMKTIAISQEDLDEAEANLRKAIDMSTSLNDSFKTYQNLEVHEELQYQNTCAENATKLLLLLLLQSNRASEADQILVALGYKWRMAENLLNYHKCILPIEDLKPSDPFVYCASQAYDQSMIDHLKYVFRNDAPYWSEHQYDFLKNFSRLTGYFSYIYPFRERSAKCSIEQIIDSIREVVCQQYPLLNEANYAEWWVHSRPHCCGHQMHFDSDETRIQHGGSPQHPIITTVTYVNGDVGGPTVVTDQTLAGPLATSGWIVPPEDNRLLAFDATYLHGVLPGVGPTNSKDSRRLTFMVGFWRKLEAKPRGVDVAGPGQPFPDETTKMKWSKEMNFKPEWEPLKKEVSKRILSKPNEFPKLARRVDCVWEKLPVESTEKEASNYNKFFQGF